MKFSSQGFAVAIVLVILNLAQIEASPRPTTAPARRAPKLVRRQACSTDANQNTFNCGNNDDNGDDDGGQTINGGLRGPNGGSVTIISGGSGNSGSSSSGASSGGNGNNSGNGNGVQVTGNDGTFVVDGTTLSDGINTLGSSTYTVTKSYLFGPSITQGPNLQLSGDITQFGSCQIVGDITQGNCDGVSSSIQAALASVTGNGGGGNSNPAPTSSGNQGSGGSGGGGSTTPSSSPSSGGGARDGALSVHAPGLLATLLCAGVASIAGAVVAL